MGAGGIGVDVAEYHGRGAPENPEESLTLRPVGIDPTNRDSWRASRPAAARSPARLVHSRPTQTTATSVRDSVARRAGSTGPSSYSGGVRMVRSHVITSDRRCRTPPHGRRRADVVLEVDTVVVCTGRRAAAELSPGPAGRQCPGRPCRRRRDTAARLDAARAIRQATEVAAALWRLLRESLPEACRRSRPASRWGGPADAAFGHPVTGVVRAGLIEPVHTPLSSSLPTRTAQDPRRIKANVYGRRVPATILVTTFQ